eukprot:147165_1
METPHLGRMDETIKLTVNIKTEQDKIFANNDLKDEIEEETESDYPDVDVYVTREAKQVTQGGLIPSKYVDLVSEWKYVLVAVAGSLVCCCCCCLVWFIRRGRGKWHKSVVELNHTSKVINEVNANMETGDTQANGERNNASKTGTIKRCYQHAFEERKYRFHENTTWDG